MEMKTQRKAQVTYFYAGLDDDMDSHRDIRLDKGIPILLLQEKAGKFFPWVIMTCLGEEKSEGQGSLRGQAFLSCALEEVCTEPLL